MGVNRLMALVAGLGCSCALPAFASETSVAVLVETTGGTAALPEGIESDLQGRGFRVVTSDETRAAMRFLALASPVDEPAAERLRLELGVDRLLVASDWISPEGSPGVMAVSVGGANVTRRFGLVVAPTTFDRDARKVVERLPVTVEPLRMGTAAVGATAFTSRPLPPASAAPRSTFGKRSTYEIGAAAGFYDGSTKYDFGDGGTSRSNLTDLLVSPTVGWFPLSNVELLGRVSYRYSYETATGDVEDSYSGRTMSGGIAVLPRVGKDLRVGPQVTGGLTSSREKYSYSYVLDDLAVFRQSVSGTRATVGVAMKVPVGASALLTVEGHYFTEVFGIRLRVSDEEADTFGTLKGTGRRSGGEVVLGFSYWNRSGR